MTLDRGNPPRGEFRREMTRASDRFDSPCHVYMRSNEPRRTLHGTRNVNETQPIKRRYDTDTIRENDRSFRADYITEFDARTRDANVALGGKRAVRNCESQRVPHGLRADKNDRYSFLKRIQMWQCLRHCDAGMDMARCGQQDGRSDTLPTGAKIARGKIFEFGPGRTRIARKRIDRFKPVEHCLPFRAAVHYVFSSHVALCCGRVHRRINCGPLRARIYRVRACYVLRSTSVHRCRGYTGLICISARRRSTPTTRFASLRVRSLRRASNRSILFHPSAECDARRPDSLSSRYCCRSRVTAPQQHFSSFGCEDRSCVTCISWHDSFSPMHAFELL